MWLLWFAPLLVPVLWFAREYYDDHKEIIEIQLPVKFGHKPNPTSTLSNYEQLSRIVIRYPNANKYTVTQYGHPIDSVDDNASLEYNRRDGTLKDLYAATFGTGRSYLWNKVTDKAINAVAQSMRMYRQKRAEAPKGKIPLPLISVEDILKRNGARLVTRHY